MASQLFDISGRVALIAGASRGIGRAIAQGLAEAGVSISLCSRTQADLLKAAEEVRSFGYRVEVFPADLSNMCGRSRHSCAMFLNGWAKLIFWST